MLSYNIFKQKHALLFAIFTITLIVYVYFASINTHNVFQTHLTMYYKKKLNLSSIQLNNSSNSSSLLSKSLKFLKELGFTNSNLTVSRATDLSKNHKKLSDIEKELFALRNSFAKQKQWVDQEKNSKKLILFWNIPFNSKSMPLENGFGYMQRSPHGFVTNSSTCGSCFFSYDKNLITVSDAVIFHGMQINSETLPQCSARRPEQLYVWWFQESIARNAGRLTVQPDFINITMTVRRSSVAYSPYASFSGIVKMLWSEQHGNDLMNDFAVSTGYISANAESTKNEILQRGSSVATKINNLPQFAEVSKHLVSLLEKKTRLVAWLVSNCGNTAGANLRMQFFRSLQTSGLSIDLYGGCGGKPLPLSRWEPAFFDLFSNYKFYLAMENAIHCRDYMTEKLWFNALYSGAVPVIFGPHRDDIAAVLPPKSYIHAEDFSNVHKLVEYLHYLDKNATAYSEYLEWRTWVDYLDENGNFHSAENSLKTDNAKSIESFLLNKTEIPTYASFCGLCRGLCKEKKEHKVIHDLVKWSNDDRPECLNPSVAHLNSLLNA